MLLDFSNQSYLLNGTGFAAFGGSPGITFSRGTNATMIDSTGQLTYAPSNMLLNSESFGSTSWILGGANIPTVSSNVIVAPDGTTTADAVTFPSTSSLIRQTPTGAIVGVNYSISVWLKTDTPKILRLLSNTNTSVIASILCSVTTEWQRFSLVRVCPVGATSVSIQVDSGGGAEAGTYYMWGAQMEAVTYETAPRAYNSTTPKNLFGFTEEFDNAAWTKTNSTVTANAIADPNGYLNADKIIEDTTTSGHYISQNYVYNSGTSYTFSVYAKAAERQYVQLIYTNISFGVNLVAGFDLINSTTVVSATATSSITAVGNGWYRCSITATATITVGSNSQIRMATSLTTAASSYTGDGTSGAYIWGAQLSDSASVDPYVYNPAAALTSTAYYGPRFDYDPATLAPLGLLIEEARTNSIRNSTGVGAVAGTPGTMPTNWARAGNGSPVNGISISVAGSGVEDGISYVDIRFSGTNTAGGNQYADVALDIDTAVAQNQTWTLSSYGRLIAGSLTGILTPVIIIYGSPGFIDNASTSIASVTNAPLIRQRFSVTRTFALVTTTGASPRLALTASTGATIDVTLRIGLSQFEQGAFATSVIPTAAASATRSADVATMVGNNFTNWYNQTAGTLAVTFDASANSDATYVSASNGTITQNSAHIDNDAGSATMRTVYYSGGSAIATLVLGAIGAVGTTNKIATAYTVDDFAASRNGGTVATDTVGAVPVGLTQLNIGTDDRLATVNYTSNHIKAISYFNSRLPNSSLQALTA